MATLGILGCLLAGVSLLRRSDSRLSGAFLAVAGSLALVERCAHTESKLFYTVIFLAFLGFLASFAWELYGAKSGRQA